MALSTPPFAANGVSSAFPGSSEAIALQSDGRILVAGKALGGFGLGRLNADGTVDMTFGVSGFAHADFAPRTFDVNPVRLRLQRDGRIVLAGTPTSMSQPPFSDWALARFDGPPPHRPKFFLSGDADSSSLVGLGPSVVTPEFTMTLFEPPTEMLSVPLQEGPTWTSDVPLTGLVLANARFRLNLLCSASLDSSARWLIQVWAASADQTGVRELARAAGKGGCDGPVTMDIPVLPTISLPLWLADQHLRVTINGFSVEPFDLLLGPGSFLEVTRFFGTL